MAREYARIRISIADDEEFEDLTPEAQWLYLLVLLPEPSLNYSGVADWRPNRLVYKAKGIDLEYVLRAAADLEQHRYVLFDVNTEEALVRTFIRGDELLRNPKMAPAVVSGYQSTASKVLRAAIVTEVRKCFEEHPDYSSWSHKDTKDDLARLLTKNGSESVPYTNQIVVPITNPDLGADYQSDSAPIPSLLAPTTNTSTPSTKQPAAPKGATQRGTRIPEGWRPDQDVIDEMRNEFPGLDLKAEHKVFTDYWRAKAGKDATKLDWNATWRNWMRREAKNRPTAQQGSTVDTKVNDWLALANQQKPHLKAIGE